MLWNDKLTELDITDSKVPFWLAIVGHPTDSVWESVATCAFWPWMSCSECTLLYMMN